jgi:uncharacterized membrane protein
MPNPSIALSSTGQQGSKPAPLNFEIRRLTMHDVRAALVMGFDDFRFSRTDALTIPIIYPAAGLIMAGALIDQNILPFIFPVLSGFALLGPLATLFFASMSRRRERGDEDAPSVFDSPRLITLQRLGFIAVVLFVVWNALAAIIYELTLGSTRTAPGTNFFVRVFTTVPGYEMIVIGCTTGALFAVATLCIGCISFPLALDRDVSTRTAITMSVRAMAHNPRFAITWGTIIVAGLLLGALPGLLGLVVVLPVLGHATWHIYRRMIV